MVPVVKLEILNFEGTTIVLFVVVHDWDCRRRSKDYSK